MTRWLKQSTSVDLPIGPFLDSGDANTVEGSLTLTQPDIRLKKNGGAWAQKNAAQTLSHEENGWYEVTLDATDTNTLGCLTLVVHETGALQVWHEFMVVPANVWDSLFASDLLDVSVVQFNGTNGTFASGRPEVNTSHIAGSAVSTSSAQIGVNVVNAGGTAWGSGAITAASIATDAITSDKIAANAIGASEIADGAIDAGAIADNAITSAKIAADAIGASQIADNAIDAGAIATGAITSAKFAAGAITATVIATDAIDADAVAADAITEIQSGLSTLDAAGVRTAVGLASANLDTQLSTIDTVVDAILDDTGTAGVLVAAASVRTAIGLASANLDTQLSTIDTNVDSILDDTGTSGVVIDTDPVQNAILYSQLTESYNNDTVEPTLAQALYLIMQYLTEKGISGTTLTVNALDGITPVATFTLDDTVNPTAITRAT